MREVEERLAICDTLQDGPAVLFDGEFVLVEWKWLAKNGGRDRHTKTSGRFLQRTGEFGEREWWARPRLAEREWLSGTDKEWICLWT